MKKLFLLLFLMTISLGQSQNLITNSYFNGNSSTGWTANGIPAAQTAQAVGNEFVWSATNSAAPDFSSEFYQAGISITGGATYTVTFRARCLSGTRNIKVQMQNVGGWGLVTSTYISLTTTMTVYTYTFNASISSADTQMQFHLGGQGFSQGVALDDITLIAGTATECTNFIQDGTETGIDCGGSCGPCLINPTFNAFTVGSKVVGNAPFTVTATSDNPATPTYTSSNTAVATISGSTVTILAAGTTTITATQAADASYYQGSTSATLTVIPGASPALPSAPARNAWDVVSMFTGGTTPAYANVSATAGRSFWTSGSTLTTTGIGSGTDTALRIDNFGFLGYVANTADTANFPVTGMTDVHVDIYLSTPLANMFIVLLDTGDRLYNTGALVAGWNSLDIPLSSFPIAAPGTVRGFKFEHNQPGLRTIYIDNLYFYRAATVQPPTFSTTFTVASPKTVGDSAITLTAPTSNSAGAFTFTSNNLAVATIAGNTLTIVGAGTATISVIQAANGIYGSGLATATLDVSPGSAPAAPTRNTWDVVSLYSGAYTNLASATWAAASTLTDVVLQGNATKKMSNFIVEIINFAATDVSAMTMLHMDIYTPDSPSFNIWLLNNGDRNAQIFPAINGWRSIDIPLSTYVNKGLNMSGISFLKFESLTGGGKTVYVDNVYFYRPATLFPATVGTFTVPAKTQGDAIFTLTPPSSNNIKPFTYTSSNTAVARIVNGNQVSIISGGTSTITASQIADGNVGPTSKAASLVVTFLSPGPSPTPPALDPSGVVSMYTGTPTTFANACNMVRSDWTSGTTMTSISNGTNTALKIDNFGFIGLVNQGEVRFSAAGMNTMHMDIYLNTPLSNMFVVFLAPGDILYNTGALKAGWNSLNISLSNWGGADLTQIRGFKLEQNVAPNTTQIYVDNMYFWDNKITQLRPSLCGKTLASLDTAIEASPVNGATEYTFEVTRTDNNVVDTIVWSNYFFFPATKITGGLVYGKSYSVRVKAKVGGVYQLYGVTCIITAPSEPVVTTTKIRPMQCGKTLNFLNDAIQASPVYLATQYEFQVSDGVTTVVIPSANYYFRLSSFPGGGVYGTAYTISVRSKGAATAFTAYGDSCVVTTPIARMSEVSNNDVFEVKAFPNPFASHFSLDIESTSDAQVDMKVYDMIGRQLEVRKASVSELSVLEVGRNYPTGIYNVVVSQGKNTKSIRMIKR
ncbi:T9SS type A sorting domain-containing protein [Flavobacterium luteum]|uniref:T9SS type A sorting domain-containing protein n=1 Tax=Flavobacterium luteum TaxID=2026654 RepID=A0A7J5A9Q8_9FLAO|nr:T9SS type A sorting domain-containing protein [Flavobacterium luteum]KAB1154296.1 T9SS type A sorting domain-containing protein [Flavobacterium luteum]